jgi:sugar (pentulose or hexulose) kinase
LLISGGLSAHPFINQGLAVCTGLQTEISQEPEATLQGAASLATASPTPLPAAKAVTCSSEQGRYLEAKFQRWKTWVDGLIE